MKTEEISESAAYIWEHLQHRSKLFINCNNGAELRGMENRNRTCKCVDPIRERGGRRVGSRTVSEFRETQQDSSRTAAGSTRDLLYNRIARQSNGDGEKEMRFCQVALLHVQSAFQPSVSAALGATRWGPDQREKYTALVHCSCETKRKCVSQAWECVSQNTDAMPASLCYTLWPADCCWRFHF